MAVMLAAFRRAERDASVALLQQMLRHDARAGKVIHINRITLTLFIEIHHGQSARGHHSFQFRRQQRNVIDDESVQMRFTEHLRNRIGVRSGPGWQPHHRHLITLCGGGVINPGTKLRAILFHGLRHIGGEVTQIVKPAHPHRAGAAVRPVTQLRGGGENLLLQLLRCANLARPSAQHRAHHGLGNTRRRGDIILRGRRFANFNCAFHDSKFMMAAKPATVTRKAKTRAGQAFRFCLRFICR